MNARPLLSRLAACTVLIAAAVGAQAAALSPALQALLVSFSSVSTNTLIEFNLINGTSFKNFSGIFALGMIAL